MAGARNKCDVGLACTRHIQHRLVLAPLQGGKKLLEPAALADLRRRFLVRIIAEGEFCNSKSHRGNKSFLYGRIMREKEAANQQWPVQSALSYTFQQLPSTNSNVTYRPVLLAGADAGAGAGVGAVADGAAEAAAAVVGAAAPAAACAPRAVALEISILPLK